tara:strand:+ start:915 stop:1280 length:366 start_codon:yes stop_codon:yes gene_type:complete
MNKYIDCSKVYIDKCNLGLGVFVKEDIKEGELIEKGILEIVNGVDGNINPHLFTWSSDKKIWASGSGCLPYYNHSDNPNIVKKSDLINNSMEIFALKDIYKGTELRNTYFSKKWRKCFQDF